MEAGEVLFAVAGLVAGGLAIFVAQRTFLQDAEVKADARRWRAQDEARREAEEAKAADEAERRRLGVRHKHQIEEALQILEKVQDAACLVITREQLLTPQDLHKLELRDHARRLGNLGARLPATVGSSLDGDGSASHLIYALVDAPFHDYVVEEHEPTLGREAERFAAWKIATDAGREALAQYEAAQNLCDAIDSARDKLCDLLPL